MTPCLVVHLSDDVVVTEVVKVGRLRVSVVYSPSTSDPHDVALLVRCAVPPGTPRDSVTSAGWACIEREGSR